METNWIFKESVPDIEDYWELFQTTGWNEEYNFSVQELNNALANSWYANSLYHSEELIGFGRVISDGVYHALIVDLIVHPAFQGKGLGSELLKRLVEKCKECNIRDIQLFSARGKSGFYKKHGFEKRHPEAPGMQYRS